MSYGPVTDVPRADREKIAYLIQRGRPVTDECLVASALAYARFRARAGAVLGFVFLPLAVIEAFAALSPSGFPRILYAVSGGGYLLVGTAWLWLADRCRRGARATTDVHRSLR